MIQVGTANIAMGRKALKREREKKTDKAHYSLQMNSGVFLLEDREDPKASDVNMLINIILFLGFVLFCLENESFSNSMSLS